VDARGKVDLKISWDEKFTCRQNNLESYSLSHASLAKPCHFISFLIAILKNLSIAAMLHRSDDKILMRSRRACCGAIY
jgi:hypothetical protein